jgi:hypothetical protein
MSDAVEDIFRSLVAERGGAAALDSTQRIVALKLAEALASDAPLNAPILNALLGLLPEKSAGPAYDLSKWSDKEFAELDRLTAIAAGLAPSKPDKPRRHPRRSHREVSAALYAVEVDRLEAEHEAAFREKRPFVLSDPDRALLQNACHLWLGLIATPEQVFSYIEENATYSERKRWLDREEAAGAAAAAP